MNSFSYSLNFHLLTKKLVYITKEIHALVVVSESRLGHIITPEHRLPHQTNKNDLR